MRYESRSILAIVKELIKGCPELRLTTPCAVSVDFIQNTPFSFNYWGGGMGYLRVRYVPVPRAASPRTGVSPAGCFPPPPFLLLGNGRGVFSYLSISLQLAVLPFAVSMLRMRTL